MEVPPLKVVYVLLKSALSCDGILVIVIFPLVPVVPVKFNVIPVVFPVAAIVAGFGFAIVTTDQDGPAS